jgi:hypothetical protein
MATVELFSSRAQVEVRPLLLLESRSVRRRLLQEEVTAEFAVLQVVVDVTTTKWRSYSTNTSS